MRTGHAEEDTFVLPHHSTRLVAAYGGKTKLMTFSGDHNSLRPEVGVELSRAHTLNFMSATCDHWSRQLALRALWLGCHFVNPRQVPHWPSRTGPRQELDQNPHFCNSMPAEFLPLRRRAGAVEELGGEFFPK